MGALKLPRGLKAPQLRTTDAAKAGPHFKRGEEDLAVGCR